MNNIEKAKKSDTYSVDAHLHVTGKTKYLDDLPELQGTLFAKVHYAKIAHGKIKNYNLEKALNIEGIVKIVTYKDIPGENQIGGIIPDEELLATDEVHFIGMPIFIIVAESEIAAHKADKLIEIDIEEKEIITDPIDAYKKNQFLSSPIKFALGDTENAFNNCEYVFEGTANSGGQEHVYLETQGAYAIPNADGSFLIYSSTQGPTAVQRTVARVLGLSMNKIEVDVNRIGGGFGGKEDQASPWAAMVAVSAFLTNRPVKYILERGEDLQMTGKRHPYKSNYKIGLNKEGKIIAYQASYFQNGGASADLSPAVLERTLFHGTNAYFIPNVEINAFSCKTNIPPNTAFRGFGGPQGMFVIEAAIHHAAKEMKVSPIEIQEKNLLFEKAEFSYGQLTEDCEAQRCWDQAKEKYNLEDKRKKVETFNNENDTVKKGLAVMPICFGISFTNTPMNNARALIHVYSDGSVGISTGAVEMGQGVSSKMIQVAAQSFGLSEDQIKLESTNTTRVANTSPTAASATADLNGKALQDGCDQIKKRLSDFFNKHWEITSNDHASFLDNKISIGSQSIDWTEAIGIAFLHRINLSAKGHYATPRINFNKETGKGHPFAYHVYGTAIFECTVDCLRGNYEIDSVELVHDFGSSMNKEIDLGQIEGGMVQGIGWMTMEELIYDEKGRLKSGNLANYKIPDIYSVPKTVSVQYLDTKGAELAILRSKAVGEPPLMYGIGAYFAINNAILAFNPNANVPYDAPMTTEKVLIGLYS